MPSVLIPSFQSSDHRLWWSTSLQILSNSQVAQSVITRNTVLYLITCNLLLDTTPIHTFSSYHHLLTYPFQADEEQAALALPGTEPGPHIPCQYPWQWLEKSVPRFRIVHDLSTTTTVIKGWVGSNLCTYLKSVSASTNSQTQPKKSSCLSLSCEPLDTK